MKATIEFEENLYRKLKATAALQRRKVKDLVAEGVGLVLEGAKSPRPVRRRIRLPIIRTKRSRPLDIPDDIVHRAQQAEDQQRL